VENVKKMTFSERKDRVILTVSAFAFLITIVTFVMKTMRSTFSTYTVGDFPFTLEHFLVPSVLTSGIIILYHCLRYIYSEYHTLVIYSTEWENKIHAYRADRSYLKLLDRTRFLLSMTLIVCVAISYVFNYYGIVYLAIPLIFGLLLGYLGKRFFREKTERFIRWVEGFSPDEINDVQGQPNDNHGNASIVKKFIKGGRVQIIAAWCFVFVFCFIFGAEIGLLKGDLTVDFHIEKHANMTLEFTNQFPEVVDIYVSSNKAGSANKQRISLKFDDFEKSYVKATSNVKEETYGPIERMFNKKDKDRVNYELSNYSYLKTIDLDPYLKEGENYVYVTFSVDAVFEKKRYELFNQITKKAGTEKFSKEKLQVSF
jgi:hypothetical protein